MGLTLDVYPPTLQWDDTQDEEPSRRWTYARLRVSSASTRAAEVSDVLGVQPTRSYERAAIDRPTVLCGNDAIWLLDSGVDPFNNAWASVEHLLAFVVRQREAFLRLAETCQLSLRCTQASEPGQAGIILSPSWVQQLTSVPLDLAFTVYPPLQIEAADVLSD
jgi:hypothetical protein